MTDTEFDELDKFISERIDGRFEYEITADKVIISLSQPKTDENRAILNLSDMGEVFTLLSLLGGRYVTLHDELVGTPVSLASVPDGPDDLLWQMME